MDTIEVVAQVGALRSIVGDLQTLTLRDLAIFFDVHGGESDVLDLLRVAFPELVRPYVAAAGLVTAQWYDELLPGSAFHAAPAAFEDVVPVERWSGTLEWALRAQGGAKPVDRLSGSAKRMVADSSRQTVLRNALLENVQWARAAAPGACAFCRMLATRGAVYASKSTALKSHDHCACMAYPVRDGVWAPPSYVKQWKREYDDARDAVGGVAPSMSEILTVMRRNDVDVEKLTVPVA